MKQFVFLVLCSLVMHSVIAQPVQVVEPVATMLSPLKPEWEVTHPRGSAEEVVYLEERDGGVKVAVKRQAYYPSGHKREEMDLITVAEDDPLAKEWGSCHVPHGVGVHYR